MNQTASLLCGTALIGLIVLALWAQIAAPPPTPIRADVAPAGGEVHVNVRESAVDRSDLWTDLREQLFGVRQARQERPIRPSR